MRRLLSLVPGALVLFTSFVACGPSPAPVPNTPVAPASVGPAASSVPAAATDAGSAQAPSDKRDPRFPAGPGATLVAEKLQDGFKDPIVRDAKRPMAERIAAGAKAIGEPGVDEGNAHIWVGVVAKNIGGPFGCRELRISPTDMRDAPSDHKNCGLPYSSLIASEHYAGTSARWTSMPLEKELKAQKAAPSGPAGVKGLGKADKQTADESTWFGLGARDDKAPITCWALKVGKTATLDKVELTECGITWPPPASAFDAGPVYPPVATAPLLEQCKAQCKKNEVCLLDRRTADGASLVSVDEGSTRARYMDGRSAKIELTQSCVALPPGCAAQDGSCLWKAHSDVGKTGVPDPGPCPPDTYTGSSRTGAKGAAPAYVMCFSRLK